MAVSGLIPGQHDGEVRVNGQWVPDSRTGYRVVSRAKSFFPYSEIGLGSNALPSMSLLALCPKYI